MDVDHAHFVLHNCPPALKQFADVILPFVGLGHAKSRQVVGARAVLQDVSTEAKLMGLVTRAFDDGAFPTYAKVGNTFMWRRIGTPLVAKTEVQFRVEGMNEVVFAPAHAMWPPPINIDSNIECKNVVEFETRCDEPMTLEEMRSCAEEVANLVKGVKMWAMWQRVTEKGKWGNIYSIVLAGDFVTPPKTIKVEEETLTQLASCDACFFQGGSIARHPISQCSLVDRRDKARRKEGYKPIVLHTPTSEGYSFVDFTYTPEDLDVGAALKELREKVKALENRVGLLEGAKTKKGQKRAAPENAEASSSKKQKKETETKKEGDKGKKGTQGKEGAKKKGGKPTPK